MPAADIDVVLFDLGGVLVDIAGVPVMRKLAGVDSDEELWRRWLGCRWVQRFERGECSPEDFAAGVVDDWALPIEPAEFLAAFAEWPNRLYDGADRLVDDVAARATVGCLSNTNALHWDRHFSRWPVAARFEHQFLSFRFGMVKPEPELFDHVIDALAVDPSTVLFLDDNRINVDAAHAAGLQAAHVRGPDQARQALIEAGVVD